MERLRNGHNLTRRRRRRFRETKVTLEFERSWFSGPGLKPPMLHILLEVRAQEWLALCDLDVTHRAVVRNGNVKNDGTCDARLSCQRWVGDGPRIEQFKVRPGGK